MGTFIGVIGNDNDQEVTVYTYKNWYVQHGGTIVHKAEYEQDFVSGTELESIFDVDMFSWPVAIESEEELINAVES